MAELNGKYVNEENHQKVKSKLNNAGKGLIIAGVICLILGIVAIIAGICLLTIMHNMAGTGLLVPGAFIVVIIGIPMLVIGIHAKVISHAREIAAFGATSILPVAGESINYISDEITPAIGKGISNIGKGLGDVAGAIAGGIAGGIRNGKRDAVCPSCGEKNLNVAKFCEKCGAKIQENKTESTTSFCPNCGDPTAPGQKFCEKCGQKLEQ